MKAERLQDQTRRTTRWAHQHPPNCSGPGLRFLVADWERQPGFGIGGQLAGMAGLVAIAVRDKLREFWSLITTTGLITEVAKVMVGSTSLISPLFLFGLHHRCVTERIPNFVFCLLGASRSSWSCYFFPPRRLWTVETGLSSSCGAETRGPMPL
jgi:hypothetical protein